MAEEAKGRGNPNLRVIIVDDESDKIPQTLGITEAREKELDILIKQYVEDTNTITDLMVEISRIVRHANELAYCVFHIGAYVGRAAAMKKELSSLLEQMQRGGFAGGFAKDPDEEENED